MSTAAPARIVSRSRAVALARADWLLQIGIFCVFLALTVVAQVGVNAYNTGPGGYTDETAHYMSGLMLRDYIAAGAPVSPMRYARDYYVHHPTLGIGYWPPFFYILEAGWMLLFGISRTSSLLFMAAICAVLQYVMFRFARRELGSPTAWVLAAAFPFIPIVQWTNSMVMTDMLIALFCLAATLSFGRFLEIPSWRQGVLFGVLTGLALLTKLMAVLLTLVPPIAILLSRRFKIALKPSLWLAAAAAVLVQVPWLLLVHKFLHLGLLDIPLEHHFLSAWKEFPVIARWAVGPATLLMAIGGGAITAFAKRVIPVWAAISAQPLALTIVLMLSPVRLEARYIVPALPCVLLLSAFAVRRLVDSAWGLPDRSARAAALITAVLAISATMTRPIAYRDMNDGIDMGARYLVQQTPPDVVLLVSSANQNEGRMVAELAAQEPERPGRVTLRASKMLADTDWNSSYYRLRLSTVPGVLGQLKKLGVDYVFLDLPKRDGSPLAQHHDLLLTAVQSSPDAWQLVASYPGVGPREKCRIYKRMGPEANPGSGSSTEAMKDLLRRRFDD
jgi:hypothetical protein